MITQVWKNLLKSENITSYLLIFYAFLLPITVAGTNLLLIPILFFWIYHKQYRQIPKIMQGNYFLYFVALYIALHFIGLLYTEDFRIGASYILKREIKLLFIFVFMSMVKKEHIKYYFLSFLFAMTISEIASYLMYFDIIPHFNGDVGVGPTPFISHNFYNPFLAFAIYLILHHLLFDKTLSSFQKILYFVFTITMSINMFITGGRAGQVVYFVVLIIIFFQYFHHSIIKALFASIIIVPVIFLIAYSSSDIFKSRVDLAKSEIVNYSPKIDSSVGLRITMLRNSLEIIKNNPLVGVGTGDYSIEYKKINQKNTPLMRIEPNPHNMYILSLVEFGPIGLLVFLGIFVSQIKIATTNSDIFMKNVGITLPLIYLVIMLSDCYLLGQPTLMLFVFFSSILYSKAYR